MEKKQCSIDWLIDQIKNVDNQKNLTGAQWIDVVEQAKAMHKEEVKMIVEHYHNSLFYLGLTNKELKNISEMIYKETFGGNNE